MPNVIVDNQRVNLDPKNLLGQGGEAAVYEHNGFALKVYFEPNNPVYQGDPVAQRGAQERLEAHQRKLPAFPKGLPTGVVSPFLLAHDSSGRIVGYTMSLLKNAEVLMRYSEKAFRQQGVPSSQVVDIFKKIHSLVKAVHNAGIVIGDFNDLNVMIGKDVHLVDADSFQFSSGKETFYCKTFTGKFVDPLLCQANDLVLNKPHNEASDWYAFCVMLMNCLLYVDPYGGIYKPADPKNRVNHNDRPLHRITVFHPEVKYPKPATPYGVLPDMLLQWFTNTFEHDKRLEFPLQYLNDLRWTKCSNCGLEHARNVCPDCARTGVVKETLTVRGDVVCTSTFKTEGLILNADYQNGKLLWLYNDRGVFRREDGTEVSKGIVDPQMRFRVQGQRTLIGKGNLVAQFQPGSQVHSSPIDAYGTLPTFDTNARHSYYLHNGVISRMDWKTGYFIGEPIGNVLQNQTLFWVGDEFGFGFYRAGDMQVAFVFDAEGSAINDSVKLPPIKGQLLDSTCVFGRDRAWFLYSANEAGKVINYCYLIRKDGRAEAMREADDGDGLSWLGTIRGKCAAGNFLLCATDEGIMRVEANGANLVGTKSFPDTEPFVDSRCHLFAGSDGLYVVSAREIRRLKIS